MAVRIIAISIALVNLYLLLTGKFNKNSIDKEQNPTKVEGEPTTEHQIPPIDTVIASSLTPSLEKQSTKKIKKPIEENTVVEIQQPLRYKGKPLDSAYFAVAKCTSCTSSLSGKDGLAKARIPKTLLEDDKEYDFYVYSADTLVYQKSMRFSDLQFNTYR